MAVDVLSLTEYRNAARTCLWLSLAEADAEYGIVELFGLRAAGGGSGAGKGSCGWAGCRNGGDIGGRLLCLGGRGVVLVVVVVVMLVVALVPLLTVVCGAGVLMRGAVTEARGGDSASMRRLSSASRARRMESRLDE
jgi:hypothetical protein